jgi:hypothetical protein
MEHYSALKRNELSNHEKIWRKCKCMLLSEKSPSAKTIYYDSNYMTFWKSQNYGENKNISDFLELGEENDE